MLIRSHNTKGYNWLERLANTAILKQNKSSCIISNQVSSDKSVTLLSHASEHEWQAFRLTLIKRIIKWGYNVAPLIPKLDVPCYFDLFKTCLGKRANIITIPIMQMQGCKQSKQKKI